MIEKTCPLGHVCEKCKWDVHLRGVHPQTGQEFDSQDCAISWLPILLIENASKINQNAAAIESFRNEMVRGNGEFASILLAGTRGQALIEGDER